MKEKLFPQIDGLAIEKQPPLGRTFVNAFLCFHQQIWLNECTDEFETVYYRRYIDDMFVLFRSPVYPKKFKYYLNSKYRNITFTCEKQHNSSMPFLDVLITRTSNVSKHLFIANSHLIE